MKNLIKFLIAAILVAFVACGDQKSIDKEYTIKIPEVTVHIVPDYSHFPKGFQRETVKGCASYGDEIWIIGKMVNGDVHTDWEVLGHEMQHLLSHYNADIGNPDDLM